MTTFRKVVIHYADGSPYYDGWIQVFGEEDCRNGPTIFPQNYSNHDLDAEVVHRKDLYWQLPAITGENTDIREAVPDDLDAIVDLRFQGYFDGGHERISAYQGLRQRIDDSLLTLVFTVAGEVYGAIYVDLDAAAHNGAAYIDSWFVAPGCRGRGIGTALLMAALERLRAVGFASVTSLIMGTEGHCESVARALSRCGFSVEDHWEAGGILSVQMSRNSL